MTFDYQIQEKDYLDFQLYTASKSPRFYKRRRNGQYFLTICSLITALYFSYVQDWGLFAYFGLSAAVFFLFYPRYFNWRQKVHYTRHIRRNYKSIFGKTEYLTVKGKSIVLKNSTGEGGIKREELAKITETAKHFFIHLKSGASLIIPRHELDDAEAFKKAIKSLNLKMEQDLDWKW